MLCGLGAAFPATAAEAPAGNAAPDVLALHAMPVYTDFSQLNRKPEQMEQAYRHREYRAYKPIEDLSKRLKIANYSSFENPTGIAFKSGDTIKVRMEGNPRTQVELILQDFGFPGGQIRFNLKPGDNSFSAPFFLAVI